MKELGRYEIIEKIGEGGMGTVYKARQPTLNKIVALKVLKDSCAEDEELLKRFMREASIMAKLPDYSHVVKVFDLDQLDEKYFYAMEYIPLSLAEYTGDYEIALDKTRRVKRESKVIPVETAIRITRHILKGLKVIHEAGIFHRDISPQNVMLAKQDDELVAKITDFGIAGMAGSDLTERGVGMGKRIYAAPEQMESLTKADERSDIYSVGILMYRMFTGRLPKGRFKEPRELREEVGEDLNEIILRCMEQKPQDRFKSAEEMLNELERICGVHHDVEGEKEIPLMSSVKVVETKQPKYHLRSSPVDVSVWDVRYGCKLDYGDRPKEHIKNDFEDNGDGTVTDHATGLMWQKSGSNDELKKAEALGYIQQLNRTRFADYDDWKLPTLTELMSLLESEKQPNDLYVDPIFNAKWYDYWSSDKCFSSECRVNFNDGRVRYDKSIFDAHCVRGVRTSVEKQPTGKKYRLRSRPAKVLPEEGAEVFGLNEQGQPKEYVESDFEDNGDGTVTDNATGLMWKKSTCYKKMYSYEYTKTMWHSDAKRFIIEELNDKQFAGYRDWRLPTVEELMSILKPDFIDPLFDRDGSPCWSCDKESSVGFWLVDFKKGGRVFSRTNTDSFQVLPVRSCHTKMQHIMKPKYPLRAEPTVLSDEEFEYGSRLDYDAGPFALKLPHDYIKNDLEGNGDGTVTDYATGLVWQKSGSDPKMDHEEAHPYIDELNRRRFAGYSDWRLPTVEELISLLEPEKHSNDLYVDAVFDSKQQRCWVSDQPASGLACYVDFATGVVEKSLWNNVKRSVRAVRSCEKKLGRKKPRCRLRSEPREVSDEEFKKVFGLDDRQRPLQHIENDFENKGDGTVIDHATWLMWQKSGSDDYINYKAAEAYIKDLNRQAFAGYSDWRLPTVEELIRLLKPEKQCPNDLYIAPLFDTKQRWCWSADKRSSDSAWGVGFSYGLVRWSSHRQRYCVRAVRSHAPVNLEFSQSEE